MSRKTHMFLREIEGKRYILCDTEGDNLQSTISFRWMDRAMQCNRCINRWNKLARLADGDGNKLTSFLNIEVNEKYERAKHGR